MDNNELERDKQTVLLTYKYPQGDAILEVYESVEDLPEIGCDWVTDEVNSSDLNEKFAFKKTLIQITKITNHE